MILIGSELGAKLARLNGSLGERRQGLSPAALRRAIGDLQLGTFHQAADPGAEATRAWFAGRPLVAVDGSIVQRGTNYPYTLFLLQALAASTIPGADGDTRVLLSDILSPLVEEDAAAIAEALGAGAGRGDGARVLETLKDSRLAELEVRAALAALEQFKPHLVMFDGGFHRYERKCKQAWEEYKARSLALGTLTVGCIEEVGTFEVATRLSRSLAGGEAGPRVYDREVMWDLLATGEWLEIHHGFKEEEGFGSCFTRFGGHPQATAVDYFLEQREQLPRVMGFLYATTRSEGRGIPWFLDVVDADVRIRQEDADLLLEAHLDFGHRELYLAPHRSRREY